MRIAINAMPSSGYGGITYLRQLLPVLDRRQDDHQWLVYGRAQTIEQIRFDTSKVLFREMGPAGGMLGRLLWEQGALPAILRRDGVDLVFTANNTDLFFAPRPRVIAIRYTEPFVYREFYNSFSKRVRCIALKWLSLASLRSCNEVVFVSEYARRLAFEGRELQWKRSTVIRHGVGEPFRPSCERPSTLPPEFLFTSAKMIGYSNLAALVEAYALCRRRGVKAPLLIAGGPHDESYEAEVRGSISRLALDDSVRLLGYIGPRLMAALYAHSSVFIFSSLLEACPNTLIEALACGAAIVAAPTEPNREVAADAVFWFQGNSPLQIADAIERVYTDPQLAAGMRRRALERADRFSWQETADRLVETLEAAFLRHQQKARTGRGQVVRQLPEGPL